MTQIEDFLKKKMQNEHKQKSYTTFKMNTQIEDFMENT